jgi:TonB family protein
MRFLTSIALLFVLFTVPASGFEVQKTITIRYPVVDRIAGNEGHGLYAITISNGGKVEAINVLQSAGFRRLDNAVKYAVSQWRFVGFDSNTVLLPVIFRLE